MAFTEVKLWFLSSLEHFWPDPQDTLSKVALFFEKMHKVFKSKVQGCSSPLNGATDIIFFHQKMCNWHLGNYKNKTK